MACPLLLQTVQNAAAVLEYGERGEDEARIACALVADAGYELATRTLWREDVWGIEAGALDAAAGFVRAYRAPDYLSELCGVQGPRHLDPALAHVGSGPPRFSTRVDVLASRILLHPGDLERSLRFYGETLGLAVFREWGSGSDRGVVFFLGAGLLEVSGSSSEPPSGAVRLLLQVRDVQQAWRQLAAAGVVIEEEPMRKPWGLFEMVARDPDGLAIVIVEVPPGHPQRRAA